MMPTGGYMLARADLCGPPANILSATGETETEAVRVPRRGFNLGPVQKPATDAWSIVGARCAFGGRPEMEVEPIKYASGSGNFDGALVYDKARICRQAVRSGPFF
jgi:hypothetical protein